MIALYVDLEYVIYTKKSNHLPVGYDDAGQRQ